MHNPSGRQRPTALYDHYPKCQGQYWRDGTTCKCYMCCFEWGVRDPVEKVLVLARVARKVSARAWCSGMTLWAHESPAIEPSAQAARAPMARS